MENLYINGKFIKQHTTYPCYHPLVEHCLLLGYAANPEDKNSPLGIKVQLITKDRKYDKEFYKIPDGNSAVKIISDLFKQAEEYLLTLPTE